MSDDNQHPHTPLLDWTHGVLGAIETEEGLRRVFYEAVRSPHLASVRNRLLEAYADHNWVWLRELLQTSVLRLENEIQGLPPQVRKEQEQTFAVLPPEGTMRFIKAEERVHQGGAGARRKFIQNVVGRYAERFKSNKYTNLVAIEKGKTTILSVLDSLPETAYEGSTTQIIADINRQVIDRCVSLGLSEDEITALLESTRPLVEAHRRTEKELLESLVSAQSPDSVARSLAEDMEANADFTRSSIRERSIRKAMRYDTLDESIKQSAPATTQTPQTKLPSGFSLTKLAKSAGKPTGLQYLLGDFFDHLAGSNAGLTALVDRSAKRVMERVVQDPNYTQFIQQSTQQMRLQEDKKPLSAASHWITNAATDVFDSVFRGPMDELMTDYLSHHMKAGLVPSIGRFQEFLPKLISPSAVSVGAASSATGTAGAATIGAGASAVGAATTGTIAAGGATAGGAAAGAAAGSVVPVAGTIVGAAIGTTIGKAFGAIRNAFSFLGGEETKKPIGFMGLPTWAWVAIGIVLLIFIGPTSLLTGGSSSVDLTRRLALIDPNVQGGGLGDNIPIVDCGLTPNDPVCTFTPCDPTKQECRWPVASGTITQGARVSCESDASHSTSRRISNSLDFGASGGTTVTSVRAGTVQEVFMGCVTDVKGCYGGNTYKGYGNYVVVLGDGGELLIYGHLMQDTRISSLSGKHISVGEPIGKVDNTGYSTGPHLHLGVLNNAVSVLSLFPEKAKNYNNCGSALDQVLCKSCIGGSVP